MEALKARKTIRDFSPEKFSPQVLSNLLWAAWGINREDGHRTAPSASNRQEAEIYAVMEDGAYVYDAKANTLNPVAAGDLRKVTGAQPFVSTAALTLVYVADYAKMGRGDDTSKLRFSSADAGFIAQNVYLFCASEGLGSVVRGIGPSEELNKALKLRPEQRVTLAHTIGYVKK
jgi:SagB-type dehydrogenase family enzyme